MDNLEQGINAKKKRFLKDGVVRVGYETPLLTGIELEFMNICYFV